MGCVIVEVDSLALFTALKNSPRNAIDSFYLLKMNEILVKLVLLAQLVEPRCLPKLFDVEFLHSVVETGIFNSYDA